MYDAMNTVAEIPESRGRGFAVVEFLLVVAIMAALAIMLPRRWRATYGPWRRTAQTASLQRNPPRVAASNSFSLGKGRP
jgi:Tfp pilus assembly protein PilE